ncbi:LppX_LprAFG lipoprotein [Natronosporangium hydrolyticum]|uniref:LppX_LprAFG lipoprotein n=1 Tax=Natronosporangium hydrolyticum TaxID=2811111 RepID=A0A895YGG8_9ACTN|nr:LppX_LprAFG lipoprotein [Natronosporangium hydrolyticum]QSB16907.1 LppX_LprAFG lipoprotein [Natronosporangium hydrolyticum]
MRRHLIAAPALATALLLAAACTGEADDEGELPEGSELLADAADEMATVTTVRMRLATEEPFADLPVYGVDGVITDEGDAEGTADLEQLGQQLQLQFVVVDETFHYQLVGAWAELPLADAQVIYDPSAVLDPERGVANLLRTATDAEVVGRAGDEYEVTANFQASELSVLLPGPVEEDLPGTVWIGAEQPLLHRAEFPVPVPDEPEGVLTVELSEFNEPVEISAPS